MYQDAIQNYEAALEIEEGDADTYFNLGLAYEKSGEFLRAIQFYEKGLSLDDSDAEAYYHLANAYQKNGDPLMMRRYLEIFLKRAEGTPYLEEEIRTAQQMLDR
jgi:tetratricopeptide (TPR) repeat protein